MKSVNPKALREAYEMLYPLETAEVRDQEHFETIYGYWLWIYAAEPERAIGTSNWYGKVTKALFKALKIRQPRTKREMLRVLAE